MKSNIKEIIKNYKLDNKTEYIDSNYKIMFYNRPAASFIETIENFDIECNKNKRIYCGKNDHGLIFAIYKNS